MLPSMPRPQPLRPSRLAGAGAHVSSVLMPGDGTRVGRMGKIRLATFVGRFGLHLLCVGLCFTRPVRLLLGCVGMVGS